MIYSYYMNAIFIKFDILKLKYIIAYKCHFFDFFEIHFALVFCSLFEFIPFTTGNTPVCH